MAVRLFLIVLLLLITSFAEAKEPEKRLLRRLNQLEERIAAKHARTHRKLQDWLKKKEGKMPQVPQDLLKSYYFMGTVNAQIWMNYPKGDEKLDTKRYRRARSFLEVAALYEYEIDRVESRMDKMEQLRQLRLKREYSHYWRLAVSFLSYQESATLTDATGEENLFSSQRGPCLGGQWGYGNNFTEWTIDACYYATQGNVASESSGRYFQRGIATNGILLKPTYWKLLSDREAGIGAALTALVRQTKYTEPSGTAIKPRLGLPFGFSLEGRWRVAPNWHLTSSMGYMDASMLWSLGGTFDL